MRTYRLILVGFGNVGQGFAQILREQGDELAAQGLQAVIVAVSDLLKGSVYRPAGFSPAELLDTVQAGKSLETLDAAAKGWDAQHTIAECEADVLVELSYTDLKTGEPAVSHVRQAIQRGMHAITTNKGPVALHYPELAKLAAEKGVQFGIEGTVMSGTPSMRLGSELLGAAGVTKIQGIVNGTTNYILSQMEDGASYNDALADAQAQGYAEADPTGDVEGFDAAGKVVILANVLMGAKISMADVDRQGITKLTSQDIAEARAEKTRWKLIASVEKTADGVKASVKPTLISMTHPLASVGGATNAVTYSTKLLGDVTLIGPGAGRLATGYAILGDLMAIHRSA
ncbi:MAG: homoserine dehydrogenase [Chloroflexi bacterium HGW-Chloroflexi-6]|nr:MAG: homoserine dehydrogenase [Chloroflexi bacterium HGW-Chloroflexi-6]